MKKRVKIGIDLGGTRLKIALVDDKGQVPYSCIVPTPINVKPHALVSIIQVNIRDILRKTQLNKKYILGMGIGVPGPVDSEKGIVRYFPNIKGWKDIPFKAILQKALGLRVELDNDVNAVTLGEYVFGAGKGAVNLVCLTLGTGVGGGIILDKKIYRGSTMAAGEVGHMPINETGPKCNCRGTACLERYIGNRYIIDRAKRLFGKDITLEKLTLLGAKGSKKAVAIWQDVAIKLAVAVTGIVNLLNPDRIIIGGGVSNAGDLIFKPLRKEVSRRAMKDQANHVKIIPAKLGDNAGVIGASLLVV